MVLPLIACEIEDKLKRKIYRITNFDLEYFITFIPYFINIIDLVLIGFVFCKIE